MTDLMREKETLGAAETQELLKTFQDFKKELGAQGSIDMDTVPPAAEKQFALLLSGISTCRMMPGIPQHMGYEELYVCSSDEEKRVGQEHLKRMYDAYDRKTLERVCEDIYHSYRDYEQFSGFWSGRPAFDADELNEEGRKAFEDCKSYAAKFEPIVGGGGFFAWDCNEWIGLCRKAFACGIITEEEFYAMTGPWAKQASALYDSWEEYALSCLCGGAYFMYCQGGRREEGVKKFCDINLNLLEQLFAEGGAWRRNGWHRLSEKKWAIPSKDIKPLLVDWQESEGCFATDRIVVDGCKVGYMYRQQPDEGEMPDSGWRFFAGDESDEYANDLAHVGVYHLNTICNYDEDILPLLRAPYGTAYFRDEDGVFQEEALLPGE